MQKTRKFALVAVIAFALCMCFALVGCGGKGGGGNDLGPAAKYVGTWEIESAEMDGIVLDGDMIATMGVDMTLTLDEDGTGTLDSMGDKLDCVWEADGDNGITLNDPDGKDKNAIPLEYNNGSLVIEQDGLTITLAKK